MKTAIKNVPFAEIELSHNTRLPYKDKQKLLERLDIAGLVASIVSVEALLQPLMVVAVGGKFKTLQGMRRYLALETLAKTEPDTLARIFAKGIPVTVVSDATDQELAELVNDDGNKLSHKSVVELFLSAAPLHKCGATREKLAVACNGILNTVIGPISGKRAKKIDELKGKLNEATDPTVQAMLQRSINEAISETRAGTIQWVQAVLDCPPVVFDTYLYKETEEIPEGYAADYVFPVKMTKDRVKKLAKIHKEETRENPEVTRRNPGPQFNTAWSELQEEQLSGGGSDDEPRKKSLSSQKLIELGDKCDSADVKNLLYTLADSKTANEHGVNTVQVDADVHVLSTIRKQDHEFYQQILKRFAELMLPNQG